MQEKPMQDENWIEEYKQWKKDLKPFQIKLLDEGGQTQSQQWLINAMWCDWKEIKKLKDTELPPLNSLKDAKDPWEEQDM